MNWKGLNLIINISTFDKSTQMADVCRDTERINGSVSETGLNSPAASILHKLLSQTKGQFVFAKPDTRLILFAEILNVKCQARGERKPIRRGGCVHGVHFTLISGGSGQNRSVETSRLTLASTHASDTSGFSLYIHIHAFGRSFYSKQTLWESNPWPWRIQFLSSDSHFPTQNVTKTLFSYHCFKDKNLEKINK